LLVIRELIAGPRRFKDLMDGLPGISTNLLTERLKNLERQGLLRRRVLPPPAGSTVYELTNLGQALEPTLLELGKWGSQFVPPSHEGVTLLHLGSYALTVKTFFRPERAQGVDETYELHIDDEVLQVHIQAGEIRVRQGEARAADLVVYADISAYLELLGGQLQPDDAVSQGRVRIEGDPGTLRRFLDICGLPGAQAPNQAW
jgi:DNA-binding HxlR family transcriptional regulator/putative sterol carrier protein